MSEGLTMKKTTIVLADDHPVVLMGVRDVIESDDRFEVVGEAFNSTDLVRMLEQRHPDVAIIDYNMPGDQSYGDGMRLIGYLLRHFPETKILIFTMVSNPLILNSLYDLGVGGVLQKHSDLRE